MLMSRFRIFEHIKQQLPDRLRLMHVEVSCDPYYIMVRVKMIPDPTRGHIAIEGVLTAPEWVIPEEMMSEICLYSP